MDAFAQYRTGCRARRLGLSQLACLGRHTMTGLLCACGRQFLDWSADYRLFSRDVWDARELFAPITRGVLDLLPPGAPLVTAMDDTHLEKTGTHTPGVAYRRDPLSPAFHTNFKNLPPRTTLIGRVRKDAQLFAPLRPEDQPAVGAKRQ